MRDTIRIMEHKQDKHNHKQDRYRDMFPAISYNSFLLTSQFQNSMRNIIFNKR